MTEPTASFKDFTGKRVDITYNLDGKSVDSTGTVKAATDHGIMFQAKGEKVVMLFNFDVVKIEALPDEPTKSKAAANPSVKAKRLALLDETNLLAVRRHLAHAHGFRLSVVNEFDLETALWKHNNEHEAAGDDSSHYHAEAPVKEAEEGEASE